MLPTNSYYSATYPHGPSHNRPRVCDDQWGAGEETVRPLQNATEWHPPSGRPVPGRRRCPPLPSSLPAPGIPSWSWPLLGDHDYRQRQTDG